MATVLPPPSKRQKRETLEKSRVQQDIEEPPSDESIRIRFVDDLGLPIVDGPVLVPIADAHPKNLNILLNTLLGRVVSRCCSTNHTHLKANYLSRNNLNIYHTASPWIFRRKTLQRRSTRHTPQTCTKP